MSGMDLLKFITEQFMSYLNASPKPKREKNYQAFSSRWFGSLPFMLKLVNKREKSRY